ncbi:MAG: putative uridylyltransferase [Candidatus Anoxychlamydiales bacterium]|nr:putative uridylyltransferase [Candidatus Anoxychlamydiales bacterium]
MLRKIKRKIKKNPLDALLKKAKKENKKTFLLAWNRALGDISLGLFAVVYRIYEYIPDAKITFLIREDLSGAFELLDGIDFIKVSFWQRYVPFDIYHTLNLLNIDHKKYDVIIDRVDPNYWVKWQISTITPKLKWKKDFDVLADKFNFPKNKIVIAVQPSIETKHSPWREYPIKYFKELFSKAQSDTVFVLLGTEKKEKFDSENILDLRGKTTLLEALSILKNRCDYFISLDSGLLSLFYYLDIDSPMKLIALWGSKDVGVIKQNVKSPNKNLMYLPLVFEKGLQNLKPDELIKEIYPLDIEKFLKGNNQTSLVEKFKKLSIPKKKKFLREIFSLDLDVLKKQKAFKTSNKRDLKKYDKVLDSDNIKPLKISKKANEKDLKKGVQTLKKQKVALIILAAGQGTRLGFDKAKGLFKVCNKTLFEHLLDKIKSKQEKLNIKLYLSIMTSEINRREIISFFEKNKNFGFEKDQIDFFKQPSAPFLDEKGSWITDNDKILKAPDGNGSIFKSFCESNIFFKYKTKKIKYISTVPIDNPLLDPFDDAFIGFHVNNKSDVTIKCMERKSLDEKQGAIGLQDGKIKIIEYIHLNKNLNFKKLNFKFSNSGIYLINLEAFQELKNVKLKYHFVKKRVKNDTEILAFKAESFIFEGFEYIGKVNTMQADFDDFYAPLKDKTSLQNIEKLLLLEKASSSVLK